MQAYAQPSLQQQLLASLSSALQPQPPAQAQLLGASGNDLASYHLHLAQLQQAAVPQNAAPNYPVAPSSVPSPAASSFSYNEALSRQYQSVPAPSSEDLLAKELQAALEAAEAKQPTSAPAARAPEPIPGGSFYPYGDPAHGVLPKAAMSAPPVPVASVNVNINVGTVPVQQMNLGAPPIPSAAPPIPSAAPQPRPPSSLDMDDDLNLEDLEEKLFNQDKPTLDSDKIASEKSPPQKTNAMVTRYETNVRSVSRPRGAGAQKSPKEKKRYDRSASRGSSHKEKARHRSQSKKHRKSSRDRRRRSRSKEGKRDKPVRRSASPGERRQKEKDRKERDRDRDRDRKDKEKKSSKDEKSRVDARFSTDSLRATRSEEQRVDNAANGGASSKPSTESSGFGTNPILAQFMEQQRKAQEEARKQRDMEKAHREKQEALNKAINNANSDPRGHQESEKRREPDAEARRTTSPPKQPDGLDSLQARFAQLQAPVRQPQDAAQKATSDRPRRRSVDRNASRSRSRRKSRSRSRRRRSRDRDRRERDREDRGREERVKTDRDRVERARDDAGRDERRRDRDRRSPDRKARGDSRGRRERSRERRRSRDRSPDKRGALSQDAKADPPFRRSRFTDTPEGDFAPKPPQPGSLSHLLGGGFTSAPPQMEAPPGQWQPQQQHLAQPGAPSAAPPASLALSPNVYAPLNTAQQNAQLHSAHQSLQHIRPPPAFPFPGPPGHLSPLPGMPPPPGFNDMSPPAASPQQQDDHRGVWGQDQNQNEWYKDQSHSRQKEEEARRWSSRLSNELESRDRDSWYQQDKTRHSQDDHDRDRWSSSHREDNNSSRWKDRKEDDWYNNRQTSEKWPGHSDRGQDRAWQDDAPRTLTRAKSQAVPSMQGAEVRTPSDDDDNKSDFEAMPKAMPSKGLVHKGAGKMAPPPPPAAPRRGRGAWDERDDDDFGDEQRDREREQGDRHDRSDRHYRDDDEQGQYVQASSKAGPKQPGTPPPGLSPVPKASFRGSGPLAPQSSAFNSRYNRDDQDRSDAEEEDRSRWSSWKDRSWRRDGDDYERRGEDSYSQPGLSRVPKAPPKAPPGRPWRVGEESIDGPKPPSIPPPPPSSRNRAEEDGDEEDDNDGEKWVDDWEADDWGEDDEIEDEGDAEDEDQGDAEEDEDIADQGDAEEDEPAASDEEDKPWRKRDQKKKQVKITPLWKSQAVRIPQHKHHLRADPRDYSMCDLCHIDGTAFHCARGCDYDICIGCFDKFGKEVPEGEEEEDDVSEEDEDEWWNGRRGKGKSKGKGKGKDKGKKGKKPKKEKPPKKKGYMPKGMKPPDKFDDDHWEEPREQSGLALISEMAPKKYKWQQVVADEQRRSFASLLPSALNRTECKTWFNKIKEGTDWKQPDGAYGKVPRKTAWMVKKGCTCTYRYGSSEVEAQEYPPFMLELLKVVMPMCGAKAPKDYPDSCNMNLYEDGAHSVGWHADDERLFQGKFMDIAIISISFGQKRKFELRLNFPEEKEGKDEQNLWEVKLGDGDLMTMEGMLQKHYMHRVPKESDIPDNPRINLTWRWIMKHNPKCPAGRIRK